MTSNAKTRAARAAEGKCVVCLTRKATDGHPTCRVCRDSIAASSAGRYRRLRKARRCTRCGAPASGYLCEQHAAERRKRRMERGQN